MERWQRGFDRDFISRLPDSVLTSILNLLPIKEAARTSVLSRRWKTCWLSIPNIDLTADLGFNSKSLEESSPDFYSESFNPMMWLSSASHILLARAHAHSPSEPVPINCCRIAFNLFTEYDLLFGSLILSICKNGIQKLHLANDSTDQYMIPVHVFFCSTLQSLQLSSCAITLPLRFTGWNAMKKIVLSWTFISDPDLYLIMSSCRALEYLSLEYCDGIEKVVVCAPKLLDLIVYSDWDISIIFENAPNIVRFTFSLLCLMRPLDEDGDGYSLYEILKSIPQAESIHLLYQQEKYEVGSTVLFEPVICGSLLNFLLFDPVKDVLPLIKERIKVPPCLPSDHLLKNLATMTMSLCLADVDLVPILSCLLRSTPNLNRLIIHHDRGISEIDGLCWERHQVTDCMRNSLSYVDFELADLNCRSLVKFIKFLLMNSRVLKIMTVGYCDDFVQPSLVEDDLQSVRWASGGAILKFGPFISE